MKPAFFPTPADFRAWLEANHACEKELLVGFHKKGSKRPSITWPESVDQALCFGWIDGVRRRIDDTSYSIRFSPRRPTSIWSAVNIARMAELTRDGLVHRNGLAAFARRTADKSQIYSYEQRTEAVFDKASLAAICANKAAWKFFQAQPPGYRQLATYWAMTAKLEKTRALRLAKLIDYSARGLRVT